MNSGWNDPRTLDRPIQGDYDTYSDEYRRQAMEDVVQKINTQECVSLVGVGTVGKTHFLRRLFEPALFSRLLMPYGLKAEDMLVITIDPNALLNVGSSEDQYNAWGGFELIAARLMEEIPTDQLPEEVGEAYGEMIQANAFYRATAFRHLQKAIHSIFNLLQPKRIVIVFDEFERLLQLMPASFFINLRALRDEKRYALLYMAVSRREMYNLDQGDETIHKKMVQAQSFFEIFKDPVYLRAAEDGDCIELVRNLNMRVRMGKLLEKNDYKLLTEWTGGHAGLLRTALILFDRLKYHGKRAEFFRYLLGDRNIQQECEILLDSCTPREMTFLLKISELARTNTPLSEEDERIFYSEIQTLYQKHLLSNHTTPKYKIDPPILKEYLTFRDWYHKNTQRYVPPANPRPNSPNIQPPQPPTTLPEE